MTRNKTMPTAAAVADYLAAIEDAPRKQDCETLIQVMRKVTRQEPAMWGESIVGFGSYHYKYDSGREGDSCVTGFSSRKDAISIYLVAGTPDQEALLARLGRHRMGKACLYVRKLQNVDLAVLEELIAVSVAEVKQRYG